jgi:hypothetical protein
MLKEKEDSIKLPAIPSINVVNFTSYREFGYANSGFLFRFVRCTSEEALVDYVAWLPHGNKLSMADAPGGYSYTRYLNDHSLVTSIKRNGFGVAGTFVSYIIAVANPDIGEERRNWYHEIGHIVANSTSAHKRLTSDLAESLGFSEVMAKYPLLPIPGILIGEEVPAYFNEFLCECLDLFLSSSKEPTSSGLPYILPWMSN